MKQDPRVRCCNRWRRSFGQRDRGRRRAGARDEHTAKNFRSSATFFSSGDGSEGYGGVVQHDVHTTEDDEERTSDDARRVAVARWRPITCDLSR